VSRHIAALEVANSIDSRKPPGRHPFTDVRKVIVRLSDEQVTAAAHLAESACTLYPGSSVLLAVVTAVGKRQVDVPHELLVVPPGVK
jgi:hypothetical protein